MSNKAPKVLREGIDQQTSWTVRVVLVYDIPEDDRYLPRLVVERKGNPDAMGVVQWAGLPDDAHESHATRIMAAVLGEAVEVACAEILHVASKP